MSGSRQNRQLVNRILVLVAPFGIDPIQRDHDIVTVNARRSRRGVKHRKVCRGTDDHKTTAVQLAQFIPQLTAHELVEGIGV